MLVLGWVTAWEYMVLQSTYFLTKDRQVERTKTSSGLPGHMFGYLEGRGYILCPRPYHVESTSSRPITEVKQH